MSAGPNHDILARLLPAYLTFQEDTSFGGMLAAYIGAIIVNGLYLAALAAFVTFAIKVVL